MNEQRRPALGRILDMVDVPNNSPGEGGTDEDTERAFDEMGEATDTGSEKGTLYILRMNQDANGRALDKGKSEHCFAISIDEMSYLELIGRILREYGPGMYRLYAKKQGQPGPVFNRIVRIAAPIEQKEKHEAKSQLSELAQIMMQSSQRTEALIMRLMENRSSSAPTQPDPMDGMLKMSQMMAMLMQAMRPMTSPGPSSDMLGTIQTLREMNKFSNEMGGRGNGGDNDDSTIGVIKALAPAAGSFFQLLAQQKAQPQIPQLPQMPAVPMPQIQVPTAPTQPAPAHLNPSQPVPAQFRTEDPKVLEFFRSHLLQLSTVAADKPPVKDIVTLLMPQVPEEFDDKLVDLLEPDNWFQILSAIQPAVIPHREWFTALRDEILKCYDDPEASVTDAERTAT